MSGIVELLVSRGAERRVDAPISAVACSRDGQTFAVGTVEEIYLISVAVLRQPEAWHRVEAHDGAVLSSWPIQAVAVF